MHPGFAISPTFLLSRYKNMTCPVSSYLEEYSSLLSQQAPVPGSVGIKVGINVGINVGMNVCPAIPSQAITEMHSNLLYNILSKVKKESAIPTN